LRSGVGTQMSMMSTSRSTSALVVAVRRPFFTTVARSADDTSGMELRPALMSATLSSLMSYPTTARPALANSTASGRPT
jgi:hypothetical protein